MMHNNFNKTEKELSLMSDIMIRVKTIRRIRSFMASPAASILLAGVFLLFGSIFVSIGDVVANSMAQSDWSLRISYIYSALLHSRLVVQVLAVLVMLSCTMIIIRSLRFMRTPLYTMGSFIASPFKILRS